MSRDFGKEIDEIKNNIKEMYEIIKENIDMKNINRQVGTMFNDLMNSFNNSFNQKKSDPNEPNPQNEENTESSNVKEADVIDTENQVMLQRILDNQIKLRDINKIGGYISYCGTFAAGNDDQCRESRWITKNTNTDELLTLIEDKSAVKVLNCIGNSLRLDILLAILKQPMTVAQLVEHFGSNSTGQIYHHLGPLITADLIVEDDQHKGVYVVQPHRVQGIIMMLAGINDMIDTKYTEGNWTEES